MSQQKQQLLTIAFCIYAVSTLISMAVMSIGTGVLVLGLLWAFSGPQLLWGKVRQGLRTVSDRRYLSLSIALALACVISLIQGKLHPLGYGGRSPEIHILKDSLKLWYLFWPLVLVAGLRMLSESQRAVVLKSWIIAFTTLCGIAFVQHFIGWPRIQAIPGTVPLRYHATLFLGHHLSVASIFIFPFFACLDELKRAFKLKERPLGLPAVFWTIAVALGLIALFFTYSRMLWMALPVGIVVWAFLILPRRWSTALFVLVVIGMAFASQLQFVQNRFHDTFGFTTRQDLWEANFRFLEERPLLGVGWKHNQELSGYYLMQKYPGQEVFSGHAHNNLIDMLGGTGILGALAWLAWSLFTLGLAVQAMRRKLNSGVAFATGLFAAWITFQLNGLTQVNFWEAKVTHQIMWMVAWSLLWVSPGPGAPESSSA